MKNNNRLLFLLIIILVIWNIVLTALYSNKKETEIHESITQTTVTGFSTDLTKVIEQSKSSVVTVETNSSLSSGIVYKYNNGICYVVTTAHSVLDANNIYVVFASGASYSASVVNVDYFADIAVLKAETNVDVNSIKLGDSDLLNDGEFLICIGTPKNMFYAYSNELAIVSSSFRTLNNSVSIDEQSYDYYTNVIQLSSDIVDGYSGAPVLNMNGEVMGIITMKNNGTVFALPINETKIVADNIISGNEYRKNQFGFKGSFIAHFEPYEKSQLNIPLDINYGIYVNGIKTASFASDIGIKQGDVILSINGVLIKTYSDLLKIQYLESSSFNYEILRNGETFNLVGNIND